MQLVWLSLAIVATVGYHLVLKMTPQAVNPFISLAVTYALGATIFLVLFAISPSSPPMREAVRMLNWTSFALATSSGSTSASCCSTARGSTGLGQIVAIGAALILLVAGVRSFAKLNARTWQALRCAWSVSG
jgi:hypothetical protein